MIETQTIEDFLPLEMIEDCNNFTTQNRWSYGWYSNPKMGFAHWNLDFTGAIPENGLDVTKLLQPPLFNAWNHISSMYLPKHRLIRCYTNSHTYGVEGYPHTDSKRPGDKTVIVYMNKEWKKEWAGETVIFEGDDVYQAQLPKYNRGFVFPGNKLHVSRSVSRLCPLQRITLMFKVTDEATIDKTRDNIQEFLISLDTHKVIHSTKTLCGHLLNTYDILKRANCSDTICKAGALHSIFGTNIFKQQTLTMDDKQKVIDLVGQESFDLIEQFHKLDRPQALEDSLMTVSGEYEPLYAIECANLIDQDSLKSWPKLQKYWNTLND
jgi:hypothetical protein